MNNKEIALIALKNNTDVLSIARVIEDGNFVAFHLLAKKDDATNVVAFTVLEIENGTVKQTLHTETPYLDQPTPSGHTQLDGPTAIDTTFDTENTKRIVIDTINATLMGGPHMDHVRDYMGDHYIQHHIGVPDGLDVVIKGVAMLKKASKESIYTKINYVIAEGNFALTISNGHAGGVQKTYYDLFRVENDRIVEHWDIVNPVQMK